MRIRVEHSLVTNSIREEAIDAGIDPDSNMDTQLPSIDTINLINDTIRSERGNNRTGVSKLSINNALDEIKDGCGDADLEMNIDVAQRYIGFVADSFSVSHMELTTKGVVVKVQV